MRRLLLLLARSLALLLVALIGYGAYTNPEADPIDDAVRAGASGLFIELPQGMTHYDLSGPDTGRTVVLVHGFSVPYYIWDSTATRLSEAGFRVLRYDLYGRGYSDRPNADYDGSFYDKQLLGLLDSLEIDGRFDLVGLSFGGVVAAHFIAGHAGRIRTLTLIDPASEEVELPAILRQPVIGPWLWQVRTVPGMAEGQLTDFHHPENYPTWVDQYRFQMRYRGFGRALLSTLLMASEMRLDTLYAGVARTGIPVLLVWGKQDKTVPFANSEMIRRSIPSAEFLPVDSAGHLPHIEQAALVHERLVAFLEANADSIR